MKILVFGNSGAGKTTLSKQIAVQFDLPHLDLDPLAWQKETEEPERAPLDQSWQEIKTFIESHNSWIVEGCYTDLLEMLTPYATDMIFLDMLIEICAEHAIARPFEPHKYASPEEQNENLEMLISWIQDYEQRDDVFSRAAHQKLFEEFEGRKHLVKTREDMASIIKRLKAQP